MAYKGVQVTRTEDGISKVFLHWSADPTKTQAWADKVRAGMPSINAYNREYELDFTSLAGTKVHGEFNQIVHVKELAISQDRPICVGYDWGRIHPAMVLTQFDVNDVWLVHREFLGTELNTHNFLHLCKWLIGLIPIEALNDECLSYIRANKMDNWIEPEIGRGLKFRHYCDPAGTQRSDKDDRTNVEIAQQLGLRMLYKKTPVESGVSLMDIRLRVKPDNSSMMLIDPMCKLIISGLNGGYVRDDRERIVDNDFTHLFDALRMILVNVTNVMKEMRNIAKEPVKHDLLVSKYLPTAKSRYKLVYV